MQDSTVLYKVHYYRDAEIIIKGKRAPEQMQGREKKSALSTVLAYAVEHVRQKKS